MISARLATLTCLTQLRIHLINHMDGKPYHCTVCGKSFSKSKPFVIRMKNHSLNKCDICTSSDFKLTYSTQLRMHLINHMDGKPYHCTICGKSFTKFSDVKNRDCRLMRQECVNDVFTSRSSSRHNRGGLLYLPLFFLFIISISCIIRIQLCK